MSEGGALGVVVIKIGGDIFRQEGALAAVVGDVAELIGHGARVVLVHGGGPQATALQQQLGQTPTIVAGRRVTDEATLDVMKMVVGGKLNIDLCAALLAAGVRPVGLSGASSRAVAGERRPPSVLASAGPEPVDLGLVGDVVGIEQGLFDLLLGAGYTPVLSCLAADSRGQMLNINADRLANQLAQVLGAAHLVLVTGAPGVLRQIDDLDSRIPQMSVAEARAAIADGTAQGGMVPKLEESMELLESGQVGAVHIVGRIARGDLRRAIEEPGAVGTVLVP
ncbi:acetylglutamate kinase [Haliangium ochraceum]|uniref:Acetylglutamate kinase n=1 Tax=Haliangium ochraceum (strain DSM 14365 / JCM 11303 / SMP-2) TaxID=502025 RepID=D0LU60_HALO1|nr:acetylglutamate kinase [Haliangium ochraceum]ACY17424.1 acetylglutamate kinase [Haliangium ochraceum DSM 14365]